MKVLVIVDMQNDFLTGPLGNAACQNAITAVIDVLKKEKYDYVYLTRDTHQTNYMETQEGKKLPILHCVENTAGWEVEASIMKVVNELYKNQHTIVDKPTFGSVRLAELLKDKCKNEISTEISFVGVCTGICVISNVLLAKANLHEAKIQVIENACACVTKDTHKIAIEAMKTCQIDVI